MLRKEIRAAALDEIICDSNQAVSRHYSFPESFSGFKGHFPGKPILPAIVQLLIVVSLMEEHTGRAQQLLAVEDAKFLQPILPDQEILISCQQRTVGGKLLHNARLTVNDKLVAVFLLRLGSKVEE